MNKVQTKKSEDLGAPQTQLSQFWEFGDKVNLKQRNQHMACYGIQGDSRVHQVVAIIVDASTLKGEHTERPKGKKWKEAFRV